MEKINNYLKKCFENHKYFEQAQKTSDIPLDISNIITKLIPQELYKCINSDDYIVKGSVGAGMATKTPWIAILDKGITKTTREGVYVVFLFSSDYKKVYLTFNQGTTVSGQFGLRLNINKILQNSNKIRNLLELDDPNLNMDEQLDVFDDRYKAGAIYYTLWNIDDNENCKKLFHLYMDIYKQYKNSLNMKGDKIFEKESNKILIINLKYIQYISAIKTMPFVLLAGISGTGKSRIVRQLARACDNLDENPWKVQKPKNFEMIQVKPNWHDSSELLGYVSRIDGEKYVVGDFLKFIVRAWENLDTPHFLCLDEMNLAPVEQYFAEYLSVIESRRLNEETREIETDPIVKKEEMQWYQNLVNALLSKSEKKEALIKQFMEKGIAIPQNLIVMGTVNMDETTFSFSRKVLDRAMTIEMNEVKLDGGLTEEDLKKEQFTISAEDIIPQVVEGKDVYGGNKDLCDRVITYLQNVNEVLEGTPFKIAYRTRNEFLIYAVNRGEKNYELAIDEMTSMKILSRIEGDAAKLLNVKGESVLDGLHKLLIEVGLNAETSLSLQKINEMQKRLNTGYTSYWS